MKKFSVAGRNECRIRKELALFTKCGTFVLPMFF